MNKQTVREYESMPPIWKTVKFGQLAEFKNGLNYRANESGELIRVLGVGDFQNKSVLSNASELSFVPLEKQPSDDELLQDGDLVFVRSNGNKELVGRCLIVYPGNERVGYSGFTIRARLKTDIVASKYISLVMQNGLLKAALKREGAGTNISNLNQKILQGLEIPIPPEKEQTAIADLLTIWDEAIEKTERLIAAKEKRLSALYQTYFRPHSGANNHWLKRKIGEYLQPRKEKAVPSDDAPLFSLTIEGGVTAKTDRYNREFLVRDSESKAYKIVYPGDIVFNPANLRWGAIARSELNHRVVVSPIYEVLEVKDSRIDSDFLTHALTCPRQIEKFAKKVEGTLIERMAVKLDAFLLTEMQVPESMDEQRAISNILNSAVVEIGLIKQIAEKYRTQKRGLMQKLLTGEWRVKPAKEVA